MCELEPTTQATGQPTQPTQPVQPVHPVPPPRHMNAERQECQLELKILNKLSKFKTTNLRYPLKVFFFNTIYSYHYILGYYTEVAGNYFELARPLAQYSGIMASWDNLYWHAFQPLCVPYCTRFQTKAIECTAGTVRDFVVLYQVISNPGFKI